MGGPLPAISGAGWAPHKWVDRGSDRPQLCATPTRPSPHSRRQAQRQRPSSPHVARGSTCWGGAAAAAAGAAASARQAAAVGSRRQQAAAGTMAAAPFDLEAALRHLQARADGDSSGSCYSSALSASELCTQLVQGRLSPDALVQRRVPALLARLAAALLGQLQQLLPAGSTARPLSPQASLAIKSLASELLNVISALGVLSYPTAPSMRAVAEQVAGAGLPGVLAHALRRAADALLSDEGLAFAPLKEPEPWLALCVELLRLTVVTRPLPDRDRAGATGDVLDAHVGASGQPAALAYCQILVGALQLTEHMAATATLESGKLQAVLALCSSAMCQMACDVASARGSSSTAAQQPALRRLGGSRVYVHIMLVLLMQRAAELLRRCSSSNSSRVSASGGGNVQQQRRLARRYLDSLTARLGLSESVQEPSSVPGVTQALPLQPPVFTLSEVCHELSYGLPRGALGGVPLAGASGSAGGADGDSGEQQLVQQLLQPVPLVLMGCAACALDAGLEFELTSDLVSAACAVLQCMAAAAAAGVGAETAPDVLQLTQLCVSLLERLVACCEGDAGRRAGKAAACVVELVRVMSAVTDYASAAGCDAAAAWQGVCARACGTLESYLRVLHGGQPRAVADALPRILWLVLEQQGESALVLPAAGLPVAGLPVLQAAAIAAPAHGPEQQGLFCLAITSLKLIARDPDELLCGFEVVRDCAAAALAMAAASRGAPELDAARVPWAALLAHALHLVSVLLAGVDDRISSPSALVRTWLSMVEDVLAGLEQQQGSVGGDAAAAAAAAAGEPGEQQEQEQQQQAAVVELWAGAKPQLQQLQEELLPTARQAQRLLCCARAAIRGRSGAACSSSNGNGTAAEQQQQQPADAGGDADMAALVTATSDADVLRVLQRSAVLQALPQQLTAWAAATCATLPHRFACNNPGCTSLAGSSELSLVSGKRCVCNGCRTARYCSDACQAAHWLHHKPVCRRLKRKAAAAAAAREATE